MVRRAIESGERKFGIALLEPGRQRYVEYGTMLDIRDCLVLSDGGSILSTVGMRRFRVLARGETDGYDTANVEFIKDEPIDESKLHLIQDLHRQVWKKAKDWHDNLPNYKKIDILKSFGKMPDLEEHWEHVIDGPAWAWWIIAILPLHPQLKVSV
jgi:Lon protease-like protein